MLFHSREISSVPLPSVYLEEYENLELFPIQLTLNLNTLILSIISLMVLVTRKICCWNCLTFLSVGSPAVRLCLHSNITVYTNSSIRKLFYEAVAFKLLAARCIPF